MTWFKSSDTSCQIINFSLKAENGQAVFDHPKISISNETLTIKKNGVLSVVFNVIAESEGGAIKNKNVKVNIEITCGEEILSFTQSSNDVFNIFKSKVSTISLTYPLAEIWTVSHQNAYINSNNGCPISSYKLCVDASCQEELTGSTFMVSGNDLTVDVSNPLTNETIYLSPVTSGGVTNPKPITIKVCGNETISLLAAGPQKFSEIPSDSLTIVKDVSTWFSVDDAECSVYKYTLKTADGGADLSNHDSVSLATNTLTMLRNNVYQLVFIVQAETTGGVTGNQIVNLDIAIICGAETLSLAQSSNDVFNIFKSMVSTVSLTYPLAEIWTVSHQNAYINSNNGCPISSYKLCVDADCNVELTGSTTFIVSGNDLTVDISSPITNETVYLSPVTSGGVTNPKLITIKVCGNETISLMVADPQTISEIPSDSLTIVKDVSIWFSVDDAQCSVYKYTLKTADGGADLSNHDSVSLASDTLTMLRNNVYQLVFIVQAETTGGVTGNQIVNLDIAIICGAETLSLAQSSNDVFNIFKSMVSTVSLTYPLAEIWTVSHKNAYINSNNGCPILSYKLCVDASCQEQLTGSTFIVSGNDLTVDISNPITNETIYLSPVTSGGVTNPGKILIKVCGNEVISLAQAEKLTISEQPNVSEATVYNDISLWYSNSDPACPINSYSLKSSGSVFTHDKISLVNKTLTILKNDLFQANFEVDALSSGGKTVTKSVYVIIAITCGDDILTLAEPKNAVFNILESKAQNVSLTYPLQSIWAVSHPNNYINTNNGCKITGYKLCSDITCAKVATSSTFSMSGTGIATNLSVNVSIPIMSETIYITPVTTGDVMDPRPIIIKVCGNETISLAVQGAFEISELPSDSLTIKEDVATWFKTDDIQCPIDAYFMKVVNKEDISAHPELNLIDHTILILRNNVFQVNFDLQARTVSGVTKVKRVNLDIAITCGAETLTLAQPTNDVFDILIDNKSGTDLTYPLSGIWTVTHKNSYINTNDGCSITSFKLCSDSDCSQDAKSSSFSVSGNDLLVNTSSTISSESIYLTPVTAGGVMAPQLLKIEKDDNTAPKFEKPLIQTFKVKLTKGQDGEIEDDSTIQYVSPKAIDKDGDKIEISFDLKGNSFLKAKQNKDNSFTLEVYRKDLKQESKTVSIKVNMKDSQGTKGGFNQMNIEIEFTDKSEKTNSENKDLSDDQESAKNSTLSEEDKIENSNSQSLDANDTAQATDLAPQIDNSLDNEDFDEEEEEVATTTTESGQPKVITESADETKKALASLVKPPQAKNASAVVEEVKEEPKETPIESALKQEKNEPEVKIIGAIIPPGKVLVSKKAMSNLLKKSLKNEQAKNKKLQEALALKLKQAEEGKIKYKPPPPVKFSNPKISRDGKIAINFNQPLKVPDFISKGQQGRRLQDGGIPLSELNVQRDVVEFFFVLKSDEEADKVVYSLEMEEWTEKGMKVKIDFKNPLLVSRGQNSDAVVTVIKNKSLFVSMETGLSLSDEDSTFANAVPSQVPKDTDLKLVQGQAEFSTQTLKIFMFAQLVLQIFLKGAINDLWGLFFSLQIMCYLDIYDTTIPTSAQIYIDQFKKIILFDMLKPDPLIQIFYPEFSLKEFIIGTKQAINKQQDQNIMMQMEIYILAAIAALVWLMIMAILYVVLKKFKQKIKDILIKQKNNFLFNGYLRSTYISYIEMCLSVGFQLKMLIKQSSYLQEGQLYASYVIAVYIISIPIFMACFLSMNRSELQKKEFKAKYDNMYAEVHVTRNRFSIMYQPIFLLRRLLFVAVPCLLINFPGIQLQLYSFLTSLYIIFMVNIDPHLDVVKRRIEIFNEFVILIVGYHLFTFTNFVLYVEAQYNMGYSLVIFICLTFVSNIINMIIKNIKKVRRKLALKQQKKNYELVMHILIRKDHVNRLFDKKRQKVNMKEQFVRQEAAKQQKRALIEIVKQQAKEKEYIKYHEKLYLASMSKRYKKMRIIAIQKTEKEFELIDYNVVRSPTPAQHSPFKKSSRTLPQIQEQPSLEDESVDEIEEMQLQTGNDVMDCSHESGMLLKSEEIMVEDKSPSKPILKKKEESIKNFKKHQLDILKQMKKEQPNDNSGPLNTMFQKQKTQNNKSKKLDAKDESSFSNSVKPLETSRDRKSKKEKRDKKTKRDDEAKSTRRGNIDY